MEGTIGVLPMPGVAVLNQRHYGCAESGPLPVHLLLWHLNKFSSFEDFRIVPFPQVSTLLFPCLVLPDRLLTPGVDFLCDYLLFLLVFSFFFFHGALPPYC